MQDAVQRALRAAWGPDPPQVDLYFRAGCGATTEMAYLLPTIELFWPEFLGEVIIALDAGNNATLDFFLPPNWRHTRQSYRFVYEDTPCMIGRIFDQVSYLNLDMHSRAQYIVTFDSDCALHSPVTPDLLFDDRGKLLLPHTNYFQRDSWKPPVEYFTGANTYVTHTMVSQPVSFARNTFAAFRLWTASRKGGECYFDTVTRFSNEEPADIKQAFCWMCQLGTFLQTTEQTLEQYNMANLDNPHGTLYQRFAIHTTSDRNEGDDEYNKSSRRVVSEGLCRVLGYALPACSSVARDYVDSVTFMYARWVWIFPSESKERHLNTYLRHFRAIEEHSRL